MKVVYFLQAVALFAIIALYFFGQIDSAFNALVIACVIVAIGVLVKLFKSKKRF